MNSEKHLKVCLQDWKKLLFYSSRRWSFSYIHWYFLSSIYQNVVVKSWYSYEWMSTMIIPLCCAHYNLRKVQAKMWWKISFLMIEWKKKNFRKKIFHICTWAVLVTFDGKHKWKWATMRNLLYSHVSETLVFQIRTLLQCNKVKWWCWVKSLAKFFLFIHR